MAKTRWQPAKPKTRIRVAESGQGIWDNHGLDIPHELETINFRVTGTGHERIERIFCDCCAERRTYAATLGDKPMEQRIAKWICLRACSFVLFDTKVRATVIGFEREEDAEAGQARVCASQMRTT